jgi:hypothetical protein
MFDVADSLMSALRGAQDDLRAAAGRTARSETLPGSQRPDRDMAQVARQAVFTEALLGAMHARLAEIKSVAHG